MSICPKWILTIILLISLFGSPGRGLAQAQGEAVEKPVAESSPPSAPISTAGAFIQNRFNPDLSIIADLALVGTNITDATAQSLAIPGVLEQSDRAGESRGINFNYFEMAFNAAVDPFFDFFGVLTVESGEVDVEEAFIDSRQLPSGLQLRIGKFLSAFGRLNGMHKHAWDFYDPPLLYEGLIGGDGLKNPGLRLSWTAPVDFLLQVNAEVFQGAFEESPTFNAVGYELTTAGGAILSAKAPSFPALYAGSVKTSFDLDRHVILLGASLMMGQSTQARVEGLPTDMAFSASAILYGAELTYKYLISSYRSLTWQSEYLLRQSSGDLALALDGLVHREIKQQGGLYSQLIWRFGESGQWRAAARLDLLTQNSDSIDGENRPLDTMLPRYTAMLEYGPTEFSRFRIQYDYDRSRFFDGVRKELHQILLQVNVAIGPHGAHSF